MWLEVSQMAKDDYFVIVYSVLKYLYNTLKRGEKVDTRKLTADSYGIPEQYWFYILDSLIEEGYVKGCSFKETQLGKILNNLERIQITPKGIEYLFENKLFEKTKRVLKEIKDMTPMI